MESQVSNQGQCLWWLRVESQVSNQGQCLWRLRHEGDMWSVCCKWVVQIYIRLLKIR